MNIRAQRESRPLGAAGAKSRARLGPPFIPLVCLVVFRSKSRQPCSQNPIILRSPAISRHFLRSLPGRGSPEPQCSFHPRVPDVSTNFPLSFLPSRERGEPSPLVSPLAASECSFHPRYWSFGFSRSLFVPWPQPVRPARTRPRKYLKCPILPFNARYRNGFPAGLSPPLAVAWPFHVRFQNPL